MKKIISLIVLMFFITISSSINTISAYSNYSYKQHSVLDRKLEKSLSKFYSQIDAKFTNTEKKIEFLKKITKKIDKIKTSNVRKQYIVKYLNTSFTNKIKELEKKKTVIVNKPFHIVLKDMLSDKKIKVEETHKKEVKGKEEIKLIPEKNDVNYSFTTSKNNLARYVYNNRNVKRKTVYCGCAYSLSQKVDNKGCGYKND